MLRHISSVVMTACLMLCLSAADRWDSACSAGTIIGSAVPLSNLVNDPQGLIVVGDKEFTEFTYTFTGDMPDAAGVNVVPIQDDDGNYGIRFQGFFTDLASSVGGSDALIEYTVTVNDDNFLISDAHLMGNLVVPNSQGLIGVTETFLPLGFGGEYTMTIYDGEDVAQPKLVDWVDFVPPVSALRVQKDIGAFGFAGTFPPMMSFVEQTFSQIPKDSGIPEPMTASLLLIGVAALGLTRWRARGSDLIVPPR